MRTRILLILAVIVGTVSAQTTGQKPHWRETADETIWTGRYSNCDYGYYVLLPASVIGHGSKSQSPAPNHGIIVDPAAPEQTQSVESALRLNRYIAISNAYDAADHDSSVRATLDYYALDDGIENKRNNKVLSKEAYVLEGLTAKHVKLEFVAGSVPLLEDKIVAFRPAGGIIYELTLVTPVSHYLEDEKLFQSIIGGFHLSKLPLGVCSND